MHKKRISHLLDGYYNNTLSPAEVVELSQLIEKTPQEELVEQLTATIDSLSAQHTVISDSDDAIITAKVDQILSLDKDLHIKKANKTLKLRLLKYGIAVAASIAVVLSFYFIFHQQRNPTPALQSISKTTPKDIQPGQNGAVLVLSDGTRVLLDSKDDKKVIVTHNGSKIKVVDGKVVYLNNRKAGDDELNTILTPKGRQYHFTLADGTKVWLNTASSIKYPLAFTGKNRKVTITGEAYFEVAKNAKKPFIVNINNTTTNIQVLGTHFNINAYADKGNYVTTLLEGSIKLNTGKKQYLLKPNQQAISHPNADNIALFNNVNTDGILAWKNDLFYFNEATIDDVMQEFARWYDLEVVYEGSKPSSTFTGKIQKNLTLMQALKILGATNVKYELKQNNRLIIKT